MKLDHDAKAGFDFYIFSQPEVTELKGNLDGANLIRTGVKNDDGSVSVSVIIGSKREKIVNSLLEQFKFTTEL